MLPTPANLSAMNNRGFDLAPSLLPSPGQTTGVQTRQMTVRAMRHRDRIEVREGRLATPGPDYGVWVPYMTGRAVIGHLAGNQGWFGSGAFSGCTFAIGFDGAVGRPFAAHVARDGGTDASTTSPVEHWETLLGRGQLTIWYQNRIPLPSTDFFSGSHVFATVGGGGVLSLVRVDINTNGRMGGSSGTIFNVKVLKG